MYCFRLFAFLTRAEIEAKQSNEIIAPTGRRTNPSASPVPAKFIQGLARARFHDSEVFCAAQGPCPQLFSTSRSACLESFMSRIDIYSPTSSLELLGWNATTHALKQTSKPRN